MEKDTYNQSTAYPKFELISKLFNLAIAVAVVYEKYISCLGSFCPTTQGVGGGGCGVVGSNRNFGFLQSSREKEEALLSTSPLPSPPAQYCVRTVSPMVSTASQYKVDQRTKARR